MPGGQHTSGQHSGDHAEPRVAGDDDRNEGRHRADEHHALHA